MTHLLLIGNPNCGKTTLFNALTGANQRVGNWPGVTVEKKTGSFALNNDLLQLTDLPGVYSLGIASSTLSQDEQIAVEALATMEVDCIVNVVDACHLERHLYLTSQLLELGKPQLVVLNMMDVATQRGIVIDVPALAAQLGCPVIPVQAHKGIGIPLIHEALKNTSKNSSPLALDLDDTTKASLLRIEHELSAKGYSESQAYYCARRFAEGNNLIEQGILLPEGAEDDFDIVLADARYQKIHQMVLSSQKKRSDASEHFTAKLDKIVLHRFFALPIFFAMMYLMFLFAINIGGAFQEFFDISTDTLLVQGSAWVLNQWSAPGWLIALIANGVGKGINTTLTFIPVIAGMFFFLSLLETSGYMARAAFVVDKAMRAMGLPGKAFVPMIVGFGCNVPAIMAARTLDSERDRLLTIMMSPFMSCSARLAIYAVFVAAFFPDGGTNVVFSLYFIGILMAVFTGFLLRKTHFKGKSSPLIIELPAYHRPSLKRLCQATGRRLRLFVLRSYSQPNDESFYKDLLVLLEGSRILYLQGL
jgi:ferrous iron transport protein B